MSTGGPIPISVFGWAKGTPIERTDGATGIGNTATSSESYAHADWISKFA
jgi:hypothetical protein